MRNILNNVILAHELIKGYTQKAVSPSCMIKVDIRKAYDSVEWSFLRDLILELGIPYKMVNLIMECVSTITYALLINGGLTPRFQARKGLRQGDLMSPYLFVLVMEYLNRSLKQLKSNPYFNYLPKCSKLEVVY
ncbi:secreted RxLR effector protein 78-like [Nicotiana tabacum]|uniref:Secreted RxLR effector protein 78-like n=1 Tax=Nicotiana tabacum TaxID=4097 RepID=A0AC58S638_TOBAC